MSLSCLIGHAQDEEAGRVHGALVSEGPRHRRCAGWCSGGRETLSWIRRVPWNASMRCSSRAEAPSVSMRRRELSLFARSEDGVSM
jgi:hypothetical protein